MEIVPEGMRGLVTLPRETPCRPQGPVRAPHQRLRGLQPDDLLDPRGFREGEPLGVAEASVQARRTRVGRLTATPVSAQGRTD